MERRRLNLLFKVLKSISTTLFDLLDIPFLEYVTNLVLNFFPKLESVFLTYAIIGSTIILIVQAQLALMALKMKPRYISSYAVRIIQLNALLFSAIYQTLFILMCPFFLMNTCIIFWSMVAIFITRSYRLV